MGAWIETILDSVNLFDSVVAPLVGAWIETQANNRKEMEQRVAPLVGAWIETNAAPSLSKRYRQSHPSWVRGLKLQLPISVCYLFSRTPRGCVD